MRTKYSKRRNNSKNKRKSIFLRRTKYVRRNKNKNRKTRKILRGGVVMPFSEVSGIFGNISNTVNGWINTVVLPPTTGYNPLLPIDPKVSTQFINNNELNNIDNVNVPTLSLNQILNPAY